MVLRDPIRKARRENVPVGKSEARQRFLPLVNAIAHGAEPVEIADHGKVVAVLIGKQKYDWMLSQLKDKPRKKNPLLGAITVLGDLEEGSKEISKLFEASLKRTARKL